MPPVLIIIYIFFAANMLLLPWHFVRFVMFLYALGLVLIYTFSAPVHVTDEGIFYDIIMAVFLMTLTLIALPIVLRLLWEIHQGQPDFSIHSSADVALAFVSGPVLAVVAFLQMSYMLSGTHPVLSHSVAFSSAVAAWLIRHPFTRGFSAGIAALTVYSLTYPMIVTHAAQHIAPSGYQLSMPRADYPSLTFLSMQKFPHPTLHFEQNGKTVTLSWSYRRRAFLPIWH